MMALVFKLLFKYNIQYFLKMETNLESLCALIPMAFSLRILLNIIVKEITRAYFCN